MDFLGIFQVIKWNVLENFEIIVLLPDLIVFVIKVIMCISLVLILLATILLLPLSIYIPLNFYPHDGTIISTTVAILNLMVSSLLLGLFL